ncbi:MAG: methyltransferase domain-containing protein [Anaerolineae bacterium]|nr:methyltransferase domain-containing protein [Anaerolineae bacterium]
MAPDDVTPGGRRYSRWVRAYLWATERLYHEFAWAYDAVSALVSLGRWNSWRNLALEHVRGPRVLELGFGTGALLVEMARRGLMPVGLERSAQMQRAAARRLRRAGLQVARVRADAAAMPFADGLFDSAVSTFPSGYVLQPTVLAEVARVLQPPSEGRPDRPRLVIGGLLVEVKSPLLARLPWLAAPGSADRLLQRLDERARAAGFVCRVVRHRAGGATVPVFLLEKMDGS